MKTKLSLLFILLTGICLAQVDSLKERLSGATGKEKISILNALTIIDTTLAFHEYHHDAVRLAREMNDPVEETGALIAMGDHYQDNEQEDSALFYYSKGLTIAKNRKLQRQVILCLDRQAMTLEYFEHYEQALSLYTEALAESRKMNDKKEIGHALEQLGLFYQYQRKDNLALKYMSEQLSITRESKDSAAMFVCLNNIGSLYERQDDYENALFYYEISLAIEKKLHKDTAIAESLHNMGLIYKNKGNYEMALKYFLDALRYLKKMKPGKSLATCYNSLGTIYMELEETNKALFYYYCSLDLQQKTKNKRGIAMSYNNIAEAYKEQRKYELAFSFIHKAIKLKEDLGNKASLATSIDILGEIYFLKKDFVQAEKYYLQSLELRGDVADPKEKAITLNKLGLLYMEWKKYDLAREKLDEARTIATAAGVRKTLLTNYELTIKLLKVTGDPTELLHFYEEYTTLSEDILNEEKNKALTEMEVKYKTEEKDRQIELMNKTEKLNAARLSQQNTLIYSLAAGAFLLIVITLISIKAYRSGVKSNKQNQVIIAQKQMLIDQEQRMMKELHHRVKNNLQLLASLLQLQQKRLDDPATKEAIKAVEHRLNAMLLIHRDLYGKGTGSQVDLKIYIKKMVDNLLFSFGNPGVKVQLDLPADAFYVDAGKALNIGFIFNEAINNAFKHAFTDTELPALAITFRKTGNDHLLFVIGDNGKGMSMENNFESAASFGLGLIHMLVKEMEGDLTIESDKEGSRLEFSIPINKTVA